MNIILQEDISSFVDKISLGDEFRGKTFLITGATGLIGSILTKCLVKLDQVKQLNLIIVCPVRNIEKARTVFEDTFNCLVIVECDLCDYLKNLKKRFDYIIHCASPTSSRFFVENPVETYNLAVDSTRLILDNIKNYGTESMVFVSSLEVYGSILDDKEQVTEDCQGYINPLDTRSSYSMGKRSAECLCYLYSKEYDLPVKIARLTQTFGAGVSKDDNRVFAQFARSAVNNENIVLHTTGESAKPYCYTTDCICAILFIMLYGEKGQAYNVANESTYISIKEMAELIVEKFNPTIKVVQELHSDLGYAPITKLRLSTEKLRNLGWAPRYNLVEMFERYIKSIRINMI